MRRAPRLDSNHTQVVAALRGAGCSVLSLAGLGGGIPDLLVAAPTGRTCLVEVKDGTLPPSHRRLTPDEEQFIATWPGPVYVVMSPDEAVEVAGREVPR